MALSWFSSCLRMTLRSLVLDDRRPWIYQVTITSRRLTCQSFDNRLKSRLKRSLLTNNFQLKVFQFETDNNLSIEFGKNGIFDCNLQLIEFQFEFGIQTWRKAPTLSVSRESSARCRWGRLVLVFRQNSVILNMDCRWLSNFKRSSFNEHSTRSNVIRTKPEHDQNTIRDPDCRSNWIIRRWVRWAATSWMISSSMHCLRRSLWGKTWIWVSNLVGHFIRWSGFIAPPAPVLFQQSFDQVCWTNSSD